MSESYDPNRAGRGSRGLAQVSIVSISPGLRGWGPASLSSVWLKQCFHSDTAAIRSVGGSLSSGTWDSQWVSALCQQSFHLHFWGVRDGHFLSLTFYAHFLFALESSGCTVIPESIPASGSAPNTSCLMDLPLAFCT